jgi:hypothetical protein
LFIDIIAPLPASTFGVLSSKLKLEDLVTLIKTRSYTVPTVVSTVGHCHCC